MQQDNKNDSKQIVAEVNSLLSYVEQQVSTYDSFVVQKTVLDIKVQGSSLYERIKETSQLQLLLDGKIRKAKKALETHFQNFDAQVSKHNDIVAEKMIPEVVQLIDPVEGKHLDKQQLKCIVKPLSNHLVIAGAGTGKTTTIVGKVKYLLNSGMCKPEDILVLSFTNASAEEMRERICKETNQNIEASTFHKLGLNILREANNLVPKITKINMSTFVKEQLLANMKDPEYLKLLCRFFLYNPRLAKSEFDFHTQREYDDYLSLNPPITLKGECVKSYGEMHIANFLFKNGINYEYEKEYEVDTRTKERAQYYPDFYLPDYGCYIEYFGINQNGEVPAYFVSQHGKAPSVEYREGMEWKRKLHKHNKTVLIECYSYEHFTGNLETALTQKLKAQGIALKPISTDEIWNQISFNNSKSVLTGLSDLIGTVISLMKSNRYSVDDLRAKSKLPIVEIVAPIYGSYQNSLTKNDEIDFNDMINSAEQAVRAGKYRNPYKFVIVDEYQDISKSRFSLLKALRDSSWYDLFCVGDDWQSIYRFTGSDLDYILNFSKYWGITEYSKIETTYRFTDSLIEISGNFVMQNPSQIRKAIRGIPSKIGFALGEIKGYTEDVAIRFMLSRIQELPQNSSVFFIGRYNFDSNLLADCKELECSYDNVEQRAVVVYPPRKDLKMEFLTAHKSKGLQADYVFILNNKSRGMGFPSKIQDDPIVDLLLEGKESFQFAEERRLFYVALTRAKVKTFLVVVNGNESAFAEEMEKRYTEQLKREAFCCPLCGGQLEKKTGQYGEFYGCSNYKTTGCKFTRKIMKK